MGGLPDDASESAHESGAPIPVPKHCPCRRAWAGAPDVFLCKAPASPPSPPARPPARQAAGPPAHSHGGAMHENAAGD